MGAKVKTAAIIGVDAVIVEAEAEVSSGLRRFVLVGLPDGVVKESKERVRCAVQSSGFEFPAWGEVVVGLSPAWLPKLGSGFDLAIAAGILGAVGLIPKERLEGVVMLGELSLDGAVKPVRGAIQAAIAAARLSGRDGGSGPGRAELILAEQNCPEAACITGISAVPVKNLLEAVLYLRGELEIAPFAAPADFSAQWGNESLTFADVVGQHEAKRALQIAAAGGHNLLMVGPPGTGKSMLATRFSVLLPPLSLVDSIEVTKIAAVANYEDSLTRPQGERAGKREWGLIRRRPFRAPHHSASVAGIIGGGPLSLPGEVTLAHRGVLFLDELSEFRREVLESLRQPLEAKRIVISRARLRVTYPSDFLLLAAMNPCPCGRFGIPGGDCRCAEPTRRAYFRRLSGPILDRIDLQVWVPPVPTGDLLKSGIEDITSELVRGVEAARAAQAERFGETCRLNSSMSTGEMKRWCPISAESRKLIEDSSKKRPLSARAVSRTIKTARTIADLEGSTSIELFHVSEALRYRQDDFAKADRTGSSP